MDKVIRQTAIAEIIDTPADNFKHPYLSIAKFIFTDDKPSAHNQVIESEDFDSIINTAIGMPVKMSFTGNDVGGHKGSYVIGYMKDMQKAVTEDGTNQLIAYAALYSEEFPDEVQFLKDKFAAGEPPGISYELGYSNPIFKGSIEVLKNIVTGAATFVKFPAYGKRTALLALASAKNDTDFMDTMKILVTQAEDHTDKGGTSVNEVELKQKEVDELKEQLRTEAETKTGELARLTEEINIKAARITELEGTVTTLEKTNLLESRTRQYTEAGFALEAEAEKADKKKEFWLSLSDDAWTMHLDELKSIKASAAATVVAPENKALAGLRNRPSDVPKPNPAPTDGVAIPSFSFR